MNPYKILTSKPLVPPHTTNPHKGIVVQEVKKKKRNWQKSNFEK